MRRSRPRPLQVLAASALLAAVAGVSGVSGAGPAAAATSTATCNGTFASPGVLQGNYAGAVEITGVCEADGTPVTIGGNLTLAAGSALNATFAYDDQQGARTGTITSVTVKGNLTVQTGASLILGCEPNYAPCSDSSTLTPKDLVTGSFLAQSALGVVVHATSFGGNLDIIEGGGGTSCTPTGFFADLQSPPFDDLEDNVVSGSLDISDVDGCWIGALRNDIAGSFTYQDNTFGDPDASEINQNTVHGSLACSGNSPQVQYGDSGASPNVVYELASGECGYGVESYNQNYFFNGLIPQPNESIKLSATMPVTVPANEAVSLIPSPDGRGYMVVRSNASAAIFGDTSPVLGSQGTPTAFPVVASAEAPDGMGDWMVDSAGAIVPGGDATGLGPAGALDSAYPVVGMAATPDGKGYWLVTDNGGVFSFGDARYHGSEGGTHLNSPIVGIAATPDGRGYWLVAADGGIFTFGDARFRGSEGGSHLNDPIVGMAVAPGGDGYWLVAGDGGIFTFGDARYRGSEGGTHINCPISGMAATPDGDGYWLVAEDGGVFNFGDAHFYGSAA
jgi:hypothetical protein